MGNKILILFDCPDQNNDKKWLQEELSKLHDGEVLSVSISKKLHRMLVGSFVEKIHSNLIILWQCMRASLFLSTKKDVLITWNRRTGLFLNALQFLTRKKNKLITMNWLTPKPDKEKKVKLIRMVFENPNARIIVNSPESILEWNLLMGRSKSNMFVIPDVYDNDTIFQKRESKEKYCFTGGYNNRDWNVVRKLALDFPNTDFICAANKKDFEECVQKDIPSNMKVYFDIKPDHYYDLMRRAFVVLLPLRDKRVAGLINIVKSASFGVPCMITRTVSTAQYYTDNSILLIDDEKDLSWQAALDGLMKMDEAHYQNLCADFSEFVKINFAPRKAAEKIYRLVVS